MDAKNHNHDKRAEVSENEETFPDDHGQIDNNCNIVW